MDAHLGRGWEIQVIQHVEVNVIFTGAMQFFKAIAFAISLWIIGFVWGSFVFMTPALRATRAIPYVSANPAISFPILLVWIIVAYFLARLYLARVSNPTADGLKLGLLFSGTNFVLDLFVLVFLLQAGASYFASVTVWLGYVILLIIPWLTGQSLQKAIP